MTVKNAKWGSWADPPKVHSPEEFSEVLETEVLVIGAGIAGMSCAYRAAQSGVKVTVMEKLDRYTARGFNVGAVNSSVLEKYGIHNDPDAFVREWVKRCGNRCDERLVHLFAYRSPEALEWVLDLVTRPEYNVRTAISGSRYMGETYQEIYGAHFFLNGPVSRQGRPGGVSDVLECMYQEMQKLGVRFLFNTPMEQLIKENSRVTGAAAVKEDGSLIAVKAARAVVLATGGIGGNDEMCEDLSPLANRTSGKVCFPKGSDVGDGHRAALWAGAAFEDTPFPTMIHPQLYLHSSYCFLFVKNDGKRFMNEDTYLQAKSLNIIQQGEKYIWSVFDSDWPEKIPATLPYGGGIFWGQENPLGEEQFSVEKEQAVIDRGLKSGITVMADTPEELAEKMGVDREGFTATLARYNEMCRNGHDDEFGKRPELMIPVDKPPYIARKIGPALLAVVGGVTVDPDMRVLDDEKNPIPGLYAIGNVAGGRYGVDYPMILPGNSIGSGLTFGYLLGTALGNDA